jgi:hypothetical protein
MRTICKESTDHKYHPFAKPRNAKLPKCEIQRMDVGLQFQVIYYDQDLIEVRVSAWNGSFGGSANIYFGMGELEQIAAGLRSFPINPADRRDIQIGDSLSHLGGGSMRFYCVDGAGHAHLELKINSRRNNVGVVESVAMSLALEAAALDVFVEELHNLGVAKQGVARLSGQG